MKSLRSLGWLAGVLLLAGLVLYFLPAGRRAVAARDEARPAAPAPAPAVPAAPVSAPSLAPARRAPAADWTQTRDPALAAFRDWSDRYLAASPADRLKLLPEGVELARHRREVLARLIRTDPRAALAAAVPMVVRQQLPGEIVDLLEERVSGRGRLSLLAVTPAPGQPVTEPVYRTARIDEKNYRAYVYGRRDLPATVAATSMVGIAVDRAFAVSEAPLRVLEAGEVAADRPLDQVCSVSGTATPASPDTPLNREGAPLAVEYNGKVQVLCQPAHLADLEQRLLASEVDHVHTEGDNQPGSSGVLYRPDQSWTHGTKKVLVIRVDFSDLTGAPVNPSGSVALTEDVAVDTFNATGGVTEFYAQSSFGKTALQIGATVSGNSPDVTPVLRMPQTAAYYAVGDGSDAYNDALHDDARALALAQGYDEAAYDRVVVAFSNLSGIGLSHVTYGGLGQVIGKYTWINGYFDHRVLIHEIGHNYGLMHANLWQVSDGNPISLTGTSTEYGDPFDPMGTIYNSASDFSHWNKSILQWIPDTGVTLAAAPGTYRIYRFDQAAAANLANPRALKIVRDSTKDYWIGYRRATNNPSLDGGAYVIRGYNLNQQGDLLDLTTPGSDPQDAALAIGATFNDTVAGVTITPAAQGGSGTEEWLDVTVAMQPMVQWSQATYTVGEQGGSVTLTLQRLRNSTGALSVDYATAPGTAVSPADFAAQSGTVSWTSGDMADKTVTITLVPDAVAEFMEEFTVVLSGVSGGVLGDFSTATVALADPGARDPTFNANFVNNTVMKVLPLPDGRVVIGGWFDSMQDGSFNNYNHGGVARLSSTGALDTGFAAGSGATGGNLFGAGYTVIFDLALQPDGKVIVAGEFTAYNGTARNRIVRLNTDGTVDSSFNPGTGANDTVYAVLVQPDGKIVIGGDFTSCNGTAREYLARLNADGSLDGGFAGPDFADTGGWSVRSLAFQPDGKLLVGGSFYFSGSPFKAGICRVLTTGALDATFNGITHGAHASSSTSSLRYIYRIVVQPDGKILVAGDFSAFNGTGNLFGGVARLTATGALDAGFTPPTTADGLCRTLLLQPDGGIMVGGEFTLLGGTTANSLARLSATGIFETSFAAAGGHTVNVADLGLLPDGRVLLGGDYGVFQGSASARPVWRFFSGLTGLPGTVQLSAASYLGTEGGSVVLSVTRTGGSLGALTVGYSTVAGTAGAADFTPTAGVLTWADGDTATKTINVPLTTDALADEGEAFTINLGQPLVGAAILGTVQQATITVNDPAPTGFAGWQLAKFTAGELLSAAISGPNADPDADGYANLVEYALGLEPKIASTTGLPGVSTVGSDWVYTYTRPASVTDLTYSVEVSTNLSTWGTGGVTHELVSSSGGIETWQAKYPLVSATNAFFRLNIIR